MIPRSAATGNAQMTTAPTQTKRPNILILMVDQLTGTLFPDGPADWLHAPAL